MDDISRKIMQMRAVGLSQSEIAWRLNISQSAVSQRIEQIRKEASKFNDMEQAFWKLILGAASVYLIAKILGQLDRK